MSTPDVAVVIPCYNTERWIDRAVTSALGQAGVETEVIVIDDGSTDSSLAVIRRFGDRLRWESGPNQGVATARNRGLELVRAPYVLFLDADDYIEGPFLQAGVAAMREQGADIGIGCHVHESDEGRRSYPLPPLATSADLAALFLQYITEPCAVLWRTAFFRELGGFVETPLARSEDLEAVLKAGARGAVPVSWQEGVGVYYDHDGVDRAFNRRRGAAYVERFARSMQTCAEFAERAGVAPATVAVWHERQLYQLWQAAEANRDVETAHAVEPYWRHVAVRADRGKPIQQALAGLIGLRGQRQLMPWLRRAKRVITAPAGRSPS